jgi:hypothetical protein
MTNITTETNPKILLLHAVYIEQTALCSLSNPNSGNWQKLFKANVLLVLGNERSSTMGQSLVAL